jgi:hypothetical protein
MNCHEFEDRLQVLLDDRRDPAADALLCKHARGCSACRQMLEGQQALFAGLAALAVPPLAGGFSRGVVCNAAGTATPLANRPASRWSQRTKRAGVALGAVAASAAAVLLTVWLVSYARQGPAMAGVPQTVVSGDPGLVDGREAPLRREERIGSGFALANSNLLIEAPRLPQHVRGNYRSAIDNLALTLPETVEQLHDVERLAPGIRPIRLTFSRLWEALCGVAPEEESGGPQPPRGVRRLPPNAVQVVITA